MANFSEGYAATQARSSREALRALTSKARLMLADNSHQSLNEKALDRAIHDVEVQIANTSAAINWTSEGSRSGSTRSG